MIGGDEERKDNGAGPGGSDESGIIVFGGGGNGCSGRGCLFWVIVSVAASVALTVIANLALALF